MNFNKSFWGAVFLICGCCIGAGMLAMPLATAKVGFFPSAFVFFLCSLFMLANALLILELCLYESAPIHFTTLSEKTLGSWAKILSATLFISLFYSLMTAYVVGAEIFLGKIFFFKQAKIASFFLVLSIFLALYMGTKISEQFNKILFVMMIFVFFTLLFFGGESVDIAALRQASWKGAFSAFPVGIVGFGFHQMVPTLSSYLKYDHRLLSKSFIWGTALVLGLYLIWQAYVFALFPLHEGVLQKSIEIGSDSKIFEKEGFFFLLLMDCFSFLALLTSFLAVSLSFVDFFLDLFSSKKKAFDKGFFVALVLLPPWVMAASHPGVFLKALDIAGGIVALALFGVLPPLMVWKQRYVQKLKGVRCLFGGKASLIILLLFSITLLIIDCIREFAFF